jgi:dolichyl-phosphate beta-glucosyltransferase
MNSNINISIVVPVYNEEKRLGKNLIKIIKFCKFNFKNYEIIVVDDGSTDNTIKICERYNKEDNLIILKNEKNKGKGFSVNKGVLKSKGDVILFTDCDLSTPIQELNNFLKIIDNYDIIIGSRALNRSQVKIRLFKKILGKIGNMFISIFVKNIKDTQCGFKLFKRNTINKIFTKQTINRWGFDFEILFLAQKYNFKIKEEPVKWTEDKESKVKLTDYPKTLLELIKIKYNDINGVYNE